MKKIILVAGNLDPSTSYEYHNFQKPLVKMGYSILPFDFIKVMRDHGRAEMNQRLLDTVKEYLPDLVILIPQTDQFIPEIIDEIGQHAITIGYFYDDMWRLEYSRFWARHFRYVTTSDVNGLKKFRDAGYSNVIYSPFACNTDIYCNKNLPKLYDVTFVGQYHPYREWYLNYLKKAGINVRVWGIGWPSNMITTEDMINIFNQSRINLNLSNCVFWDIRYVFSPLRSISSTLRVWWHAIKSTLRPDMKTVEQVKGRHFEINACGGFQLSYYVEGLERLYTLGEEIVVFVSPDDLLDKVQYYLKHEEERENIAQCGYLRTRNDHKAENRFHNIFKELDTI
ncbi:hypothetical protein KN63_01770 [Smithella sp. F21]|nr:hypothetical protein KN63_01770 [Smithella sp. F21]